MITNRAQYQSGEVKVLGFNSISDADFESAEKEIFNDVFGGVSFQDVDSLESTEPVKSIIAEILVPFVFVQLSKNRNAFLAMQGEVTNGATAYGRTTTSRLLEVWNSGVKLGRQNFETHKETINELFENCVFIAKLKL